MIPIKSSWPNIISSCFIVCLIFISVSSRSQESFERYDQVYGLDQALCNGRKYLYEPPAGSKGHPYLATPAYYTGSATVRGKCHRNVFLNYDVFNQQLLMRYVDEIGTLIVIEVSKAWLEEFRLDSMKFVLLRQDKEPKIYQAIGEAPVRFLYSWHKNLDLESSIGNMYYKFSKSYRESYFDLNGQLRPFHTTRGLVKLFDPEKRPKIKDYIHDQRINVKNATDRQMSDLIKFIGNLP